MKQRRLGSALAALGISLLAVSTVLGGAEEPAHAASAATPGVVLPNGRLVTPLGSSIAPVSGGASYDLGDFPLGVAVSPDGTMAVASLNGRGFGSPHGFNSFCEQNQMKAGVACPGVQDSVKENPGTTAPDEGLDVIDTTTGKSTQAVVTPTSNDPKKDIACGKGFNCNGYGVAFSRDGRRVYATGGGGDNLIQFTVSSGRLIDPLSVAIPSPATQVPADPLIGSANGYPRGIATTADGKSLVVVDMYDSTIELFALSASGAPVLVAQQLLPGGIPGQLPMAYLYGVAVSPDSQTAYVTTEGSGTLDVVSLTALAATGISTTFAPVAPAVATSTPLVGVDHPTGIAVSPDGSTLAIAGTNTDNVAFVPLTAGAVAGVPTLVPVGVVPRASGVYGSAPDDVAWARDGRHVYAALAGDDADAVISVPATGVPTVTGYLPTGCIPRASPSPPVTAGSGRSRPRDSAPAMLRASVAISRPPGTCCRPGRAFRAATITTPRTCRGCSPPSRCRPMMRWLVTRRRPRRMSCMPVGSTSDHPTIRSRSLSVAPHPSRTSSMSCGRTAPSTRSSAILR